MIRLFRVSIPTSVIGLILTETLLLALSYSVAAVLALDAINDPWFYLRYDYGWLQILLVIFVIQIGLYLIDLYDDLHLRSRIILVQQLCVLLGVAFLIQAILGYAEWTVLQLPQWTMLYGSAFTIVAIPLWRIFFLRLLQRALPAQRLLFLGYSPIVRELIEHMNSQPTLGLAAIGMVGDPDQALDPTSLDQTPLEQTSLDQSNSPQETAEPVQMGKTVVEIAGVPVLGHMQELEAIIEREKPSRLILANDQLALKYGQKLLDLRFEGMEVEAASSLYETIFRRVPLSTLRPVTMIFSNSYGLRSGTVYFQAVYSFILALVGLVVTLPIMALVALAVKLTSPGPALYSQVRTGRYGEPFSLYKFRSMYIDAEARSGPVWATKNDPRITPLGRWLRLLRLDELPQFFNVIRGEMSLVGPRPERPEFCKLLAEKIPFYNQRHFVKPGITGWAQINMKYTDTVEDTGKKLEYDLYYVKHLAPALDLFIIFHTLKVMLLSRGAQ